MNDEIIDLAKKLCEANAASHVSQVNYRAALATEQLAMNSLSDALFSRQEVDPVAIKVPGTRTVVCNFDGEGHYRFSIVRSFS